MKNFNLPALMLALSGSPALACEYYAYVDYGPASVEGRPGETEDVYHSSGVLSLEHGFKAVYSDMGETLEVTGFRIENLGPFENEARASRALSEFIDELEEQGYKEAASRHQLPEVMERDKVECE